MVLLMTLSKIFKKIILLFSIIIYASCSNDGSFMTQSKKFDLPSVKSIISNSPNALWIVTITTNEKVTQFTLPAGCNIFSIPLDSEKFYSISVHYSECKYCDKTLGVCENCESDCVCGGCIYPYQKKLTRLHNFSAQILSKYFEKLKEYNSSSKVMSLVKSFNWKKFIDTLDEEYLFRGGDYPTHVISSDEVLDAICSGSFSTTILRSGD